MAVSRSLVPDDVWQTLYEVAASYGVPASLALAITQYESGFDKYAIGDSGCSCGLMQLQWCSGAGFGYECTELQTNIRLNLELGIRRLRHFYDKYGNWDASIRYYSGEIDNAQTARYYSVARPLWDEWLQVVGDDGGNDEQIVTPVSWVGVVLVGLGIGYLLSR